nr:hypothetical protein Iba_chr07bCG12160 [Ipomoea batatas]
MQKIVIPTETPIGHQERAPPKPARPLPEQRNGLQKNHNLDQAGRPEPAGGGTEMAETSRLRG